MNRDEYWSSIIAFECPLTKDKHTINWCFEKCGMCGYVYKADKDGRSAAHLYCTFVHGEPDLLTGKVTRDN